MENKNNNLSFFKVLTIFLTWFATCFLTIVLNWDLISDIKQNLSNSFYDIQDEKLSKELDIDKILNAYSTIKENYININWVKSSEITDWAIHWIVSSLWDKHSEYLYWDELKYFDQSLNWNFEWIWVYISKVDSWLKVESLIKGSPAKKYWVIAWDIILEADWINLSELDKYDAISKVKWQSWTKVKLKIYREKEGIIEKEVVRWRISVPSVESKIIWDIWYISINTFWEKTSKDFKEELDKISPNIKWLIIDLRDNWGWYLISAVEILSNFVESRKILTTIKSSWEIYWEKYPSINLWNIFDLPIVVLINENSASASEITSWALQDYKKAIIVWVKSYWKWSVQTPFEIFGKSSILKITTAKWFTPNWNSIEWVWITPDIEVKLDVEKFIEEWYDSQLEKWEEVLNELISNKNLEQTITDFNK